VNTGSAVSTCYKVTIITDTMMS